jgi:hypothetical protein
MRDPPGPQVEEEMRWDTASAFSLNSDTPWDVLRAQLLWSIWCQRVAHTFKNEKFHLGVVLWHAWRNTIYCAMEAYKEFFRHKRNEEKRQELINCFQQIWTSENIFGRLQGNTIKWNITPHQEFLPQELGAWTVPPIRINRLSPSPDIEAEFAARPDFSNLVDEFLHNVGDNWQPAPPFTAEDSDQHPLVTPNDRSTPNQTQSDHNVQPDFSEHCANVDRSVHFEETTQLTSPSIISPRASSPQHIQLDFTMNLNMASSVNDQTADATNGEETNSPHPTGDRRLCPRSRPKKRCSKRLQHPIRRLRGMQHVTPLAPFPADNKGFEHKGLRSNHYDVERSAHSEEELNTYSDHPPQHKWQDIPQDPNKTYSKTTNTANRADVTSLHPTEDRGLRPRSRPKKRCSKRLQHPIRRLRRTRLSPTLTPSPADNEGPNVRGYPQTPTATPKESILNWGSKQATDTGWIKPTSRPKRKCRFGPRARRALNSVHHQGTPRLNPSQQIAQHPDKRSADPPHIPQEIKFTSPKDPLQEVHSVSHPDRVTFQPAFHNRRTPLDKYKDKDTWQGEGVNSSKFAAKRLGIPETEFKELLTREINELLDEIETTRLTALNGHGKDAEPPAPSPFTKGSRSDFTHSTRVTETAECPQHSKVDHLQGDFHHKRSAQTHSLHPQVRSGRRTKAEGHLGTQRKRGRGKTRTSQPSRRDPPPPPPACRTKDKDGQGRSLDGQGNSLFGDWTGWGTDNSDRILSQAQSPQEEEDFQVILPDRPTFFHFTPAKRSPFMRYSKAPIPEERPPPFRPIHVRLGISEKEFEEGLKEEIDSVLVPLAESRRRAKESGSEAPPPPQPTPSLQVMTKEDALRFFRQREFPTTGPLLGVWWWAADLGWSRFDYESDVDWNDLSFLNAYD